jgi:hypothetical protein
MNRLKKSIGRAQNILIEEINATIPITTLNVTNLIRFFIGFAVIFFDKYISIAKTVLIAMTRFALPNTVAKSAINVIVLINKTAV